MGVAGWQEDAKLRNLLQVSSVSKPALSVRG